MIQNLSKIPLYFRFRFGFVLGCVNPLFGMCFRVYLRLVENLKLASGLTLRCARSFLREGFRIYVFNLFISIYIYIYKYIHIDSLLYGFLWGLIKGFFIIGLRLV